MSWVQLYFDNSELWTRDIYAEYIYANEWRHNALHHKIVPPGARIILLVCSIMTTQSELKQASGHSMMTSSNGNIFRVTDHLCGEFTGHRWIPRTKASDAELYYDVIVMVKYTHALNWYFAHLLLWPIRERHSDILYLSIMFNTLHNAAAGQSVHWIEINLKLIRVYCYQQ